MEAEPSHRPPSPPPRHRPSWSAEEAAAVGAVGRDVSDHLGGDDALKKQVAELIVHSKRDQTTLEQQSRYLEVLQQRLARTLAPQPSGTSSSHQSQSLLVLRDPAPSPAATILNADQQPLNPIVPIEAGPSAVDGTPSYANAQVASLKLVDDPRQPANDEILQNLELEAVVKTNETLLRTVEELQSSFETSQRMWRAEIEEAIHRQRAAEDRLAVVELDKEKLRERIADEVLLKSQRNRIEMAARRIAAPRTARLAGLRRMEALERNAMQAHDDAYYVRRDAAARFPVFNVTLALVCFSGLDELEAQSPEMVPFVVDVVQATLQALCAKRGGYCVTAWKHFGCFAFRDAHVALAFAAAAQLELKDYDWPDTVVFCPPFRREVVAVAPNADVPASSHTANDNNNAVNKSHTLSKPHGGHQQRGLPSPASAVAHQASAASPKYVSIFNGPKLHVYLHHGTPCSDIDHSTGKLFFFGSEVNVAVSTLAHLVRPGEIAANEAWVLAMHDSSQVLPENLNPESGREDTAAAVSFGARVATCQSVADLLKQQHFDCEVRSTLPRILMVTATEPIRKSAFAEVPPPLPQPFHVPLLLSIIPESLKFRRHKFKELDAVRPATHDTTMAFLLLANRSINGRAYQPRYLTSDMAVWIQQAAAAANRFYSAACQLQGQPSAPNPLIHSSPDPSIVIAAGGVTAAYAAAAAPWQRAAPAAGGVDLNVTMGAGGVASPRKQKSNVLSQGPQGTQGTATTPQQPSVTSKPTDISTNASFTVTAHRRLSVKGSVSVSLPSNSAVGGSAHAAASAAAAATEASSPTALSLAAAASPATVGPIISLPFPPLHDLADKGHTAAATKREARWYFKAKLYELHARNFETERMRREDAYLSVRERPLWNSDHPPKCFVAVDVANSKSFDGFEPVRFAQFTAQFRELVIKSAGLSAGFLNPQLNGMGAVYDDVYFVAFQHAQDAFQFCSTIHIKFRDSGLLDTLSPDGLSLETLSLPKLNAAGVHVRCGIDFGNCRIVSIPSSSGSKDSSAGGASVVCLGGAMDEAAYLCGAALPGETLVSHRAMKSFQSTKANAVSLLYTVVHRGFRSYEGGAPCSAYLYSVLPSALGLAGRQPGPNNFKVSRSFSVHRSPSMNFAGSTGQLAGFPGSVRDLSVARSDANEHATSGGSPTPASPTNTAQAPPGVTAQSVDVTPSVDFNKIDCAVRTLRRCVTAKLSTIDETRQAPTARIRTPAVQARLEAWERIQMAQFDTLSQDMQPPPFPKLSQGGTLSFGIMYVDLEGSAKLLEVLPDIFPRCQQHANGIVRDSLSHFEGHVLHTNGFEAWIIMFPSVVFAMECAIRVQQQLLLVDWPSELTKQDRALRVKDAKNGSNLLFNGLRARIGIASGALVSTQIVVNGTPTGKSTFTGQALTDAVRLGRSAQGGDTWLTVEAFHDLHHQPRPRPFGQLLHSIAPRAIVDFRGETVAVACLPLSLAGRASRFPTADRYAKVVSQLEKDTGSWWKQPNSVGCRNDCTRINLAKKKSVVLSGGNGLERSPSIFANGIMPPTNVVLQALMDRLVATESSLQTSSVMTNAVSAAAAPGGTGAAAATSPHRVSAAQKPVAAATNMDGSTTLPTTVAALLRGVIAVLQAVNNANPIAVDAALRGIDEASFTLGVPRRRGSSPGDWSIPNSLTEAPTPHPPVKAAPPKGPPQNRLPPPASKTRGGRK